MAKLLTEMMSSYFEPEAPMRITRELPPAFLSSPAENGMPIVAAKSSEWRRVTDPNRLMREYEFAEPATYHNFILEMVHYEHEKGHFAKITADYPKVIIEVYTHEVNDITELDLEYAKEADQIRADVAYYRED
tara:strand:+ start:1115 stop:1513 length:399 start_codon:yes stop_codon:yes gene_type:complete